MKKFFLGPVPVLALTAFFGIYSLLALVTAIVFLRFVGPHPFAFVYLTYVALNVTMAYGIYRDRRWVLPVLTLNLLLAVERALGGGFSSFGAAAIAVSAVALALVVARRDRQKGELLAAWPIAIFALQQLMPYLIEAPVVQ